LGEESEDGSLDVTSVLKEGLDNHADNIQRERVVEMVGEALEGFKGCKMILERAKTEAPQLYTSSLSMLKAMIEMAKLLGLDQDQAAEPSGVLESPQESALDGQMNTPSAGMPESEANDSYAQADAEADGHPNYDNLFPAHPESGGGSNDPKLRGQ